MRAAALLLMGLLPACQLLFDVESRAIDAPHLEPGQIVGDADRVVADTTIDTSSLTPLELELEVVGQLGGPDVTVLRANNLTFAGVVNVVGDRAFIVLARSIVVEGSLDAGGKRGVPGPAGGAVGVEGEGAGGDGESTGSFNVGGGGGGYGGIGGPGGQIGVPSSGTCSVAPAPSGESGAAFGDETLPVLVGGGAGGLGSASCATKPVPGAGGGAIQLSAIVRLEVANGAVLNAGGGGGGGGEFCPGNSPMAGSGAGAGGSIYLDAPEIAIVGTVTANGGGGGGSGDAGTGVSGSSGADAAGQLAPAPGGLPGGGGQSRRGGAGGARDSEAQQGGGGCDVDAGGGGGAVGRIVQRGRVTAMGMASPAPVPADR